MKLNLFTTNQLETLLSAAGTSMTELAQKAANSSNVAIADASEVIEHDQRVIDNASRRIQAAKLELKKSNGILKIAQRFLTS
jgi:hypothetical protein